MKIAYVTSHINRSTQWNWFSEELIRLKVDHIHIIIGETEPILYSDLKALGVSVYYLEHKNATSFLWNLIRIRKLLKKHAIDLVHTELPYGNLLGQLAAFTCGIHRRVTTCENLTWGRDYNSWKQKFIDHLTFLIAKRVIAITELAAKYLIKTYRLKPCRVSVIHHSLAKDEYSMIDHARKEELREKLQLPKHRFIIGIVSRFEYWKGIEFAVEAMAEVAQRHPEALLVLIGGKDGDSYSGIMKRIAEYKLEEHVIHKGYVSDNIALYSLFDIHLHVPVDPYVETFGITIIEGMISACAQILTRSGIANDTARHGQNCLLVDYKSAKEISEAIIRLMESEELRKKIGEQARADALKLFNYKDKVQKHLELYTKLFS